MQRPQTIQIFLPDGSPRGIKIAEITNRVVKALQYSLSLGAGKLLIIFNICLKTSVKSLFVCVSFLYKASNYINIKS